MSKLFSSREIIAVLERNGFIFNSQKGSHCKYGKGNYVVIVPHPRKEIPAGTFHSILRQSGLKRDDFH
ncbi:MAG TPA: type II toxin-antitoxin system HicA family toxin [Spirochaetota bacterium]|nr:type II toxin-antitoxin system HicA family toxin [Spirochaetota bacterium]